MVEGWGLKVPGVGEVPGERAVARLLSHVLLVPLLISGLGFCNLLGFRVKGVGPSLVRRNESANTFPYSHR